MQGVLQALGKDSVVVIAPGRVSAAAGVPLLRRLTACSPTPPDDLDERTVDLPGLRQPRAQPGSRRCADGRSRSLNIDHHHDNTRFGTVNHVVAEASCTAEIVWDLMRGARASR